MTNYIRIIGARENNLKNVSVNIPKNKLVALTGPSGSGKSTFAMDILQRKCQRQYMESMGLVTDGMNKPKVENIIGLSPSISISQGISNRNPRSNVGTFTEILTYIRVLYAKIGIRKCDKCGYTIIPDFDNEVEEYESQTEEEQEYVVCSNCGEKLEKMTMAHFSFNKPQGYCKTCKGLGVINSIDLSSIVDEELTVKEGAFKLWKGVIASCYSDMLLNAGKHYGFDFDATKPVKEFNELERLVFYKGVESEEFIKRFPNIKSPKTVKVTQLSLLNIHWRSLLKANG